MIDPRSYGIIRWPISPAMVSFLCAINFAVCLSVDTYHTVHRASMDTRKTKKRISHKIVTKHKLSLFQKRETQDINNTTSWMMACRSPDEPSVVGAT
ncbi:uncharacterized protein F4807DRAFT_404843 [Annulohypoxylon truncatum]|uniref:uncharacterized protein n=1 Tax=Annulohypoxylon truncatum TaxID=327061 RepID=UPI002007A239|nr:uncharacterized protein F4807DRAFT_404843 [Annulohypoxylon truncatum]KAI1214869.1 hypothetical protein F4807DRAFT_404843 [Annulohypoxylon truncatum]